MPVHNPLAPLQETMFPCERIGWWCLGKEQPRVWHGAVPQPCVYDMAGRLVH
jgi:hypothetical protein